MWKKVVPPLSLLVALTIAVLPIISVFAQVPPIDVGVNSDGLFAFDWNGQASDGTPNATTTSVEFHFMPDPPVSPAPGTGDGHVTVSLPLVAVVGENRITMKAALVGVPAGIYDLNVRLIGAGGNPSTYSTPVLGPLRVRVKNPAAPTNVRGVGDN